MCPYENEVNLRDYINILVKRKKLICAVFIIATIITAIASLIHTNRYQASMILEPSILGVSDLGEALYFGSVDDIRAKIEEEAFEHKIIKALNLDPEKADAMLRFDLSVPEDSSIIKIMLEMKERKQDLGLKILNQLFAELSLGNEAVIKSKKDIIEKNIALISNDILTRNNEIDLERERLKIVETREGGLFDEIQKIRSNTEELIAGRSVLLNKKGQADDISSLLYTNTIQQNITYSNQLNNQLSTLKIQKEKTIAKIKNLQNEIKNLKINIENENLKKGTIHNIRLIQKPEISARPIGAETIHILMISGVVSLMLGIFLALFIEYWEKTK